MKKARIINAIIWIALAATLCTWVGIEWSSKCCDMSTLLIGLAVYFTMPAVLGCVIDQAIQGK